MEWANVLFKSICSFYMTRHLPPSSSSISRFSFSSLISPIGCSFDEADFPLSLRYWLLLKLFALLLFVADRFSSTLFFRSVKLLELITELPLVLIFESNDSWEGSTSLIYLKIFLNLNLKLWQINLPLHWTRHWCSKYFRCFPCSSLPAQEKSILRESQNYRAQKFATSVTTWMSDSRDWKRKIWNFKI